MLAPRGRNPLPHLVLPLAVVALACLPNVAFAATTPYGGTFATGGKLEFKLKHRRSERKVRGWTWSQFPVTCDNKPTTTSGQYLFALRVDAREFKGRAVLRRDGDSGPVVGGARVVGTFSGGYRGAAGTFRVYGKTPEGAKHCESGRVDWTATEQVTPVR